MRGVVPVGLAIATIAGVAAASVNVGQSGWRWGNPTPQGNTLRAIAFAGPLGYAVGDSGTALKTADGGTTWVGLATGTPGPLTRVQIVDPKTVVIAGGDGCILRRSTDAGATFARVFTVAEQNCSDRVQAFDFVSAQTGYLLLRDGSVLVTHDGGASFSRVTGVPGTAASSGGGGAVGIDIHFLTPLIGVAFVGPPGGGQTAEFATPDGGVSWTPLALPAASITSVHYVDAADAYAIGPNTLLRSADGGVTWKQQPIAANRSFNSIDCNKPATCILTVTAGDRLLLTTDGGATATVTTPSSVALFGVGYASQTRVVAVGAGGATVLSNDGGLDFAPASSDIGGAYSRLRSGPGSLVYAPGAKGTVARSDDGGATWRTIATQTSAPLLDVAFATPMVGYALDQTGGLQLTSNGGASWRTLDPGTTTPARALATTGGGTVLLIGPVGVRRARGGGRFQPVAGGVATARLNDVQTAGNALYVYGATSLLRSSDGGASFTTLQPPGRSLRIQSIAFTSARYGTLLDRTGRLWLTRDGARHWKEILSTGTSDATLLAFSDPLHGFMALRAFGPDAGDAFVLRTSDGGSTWRPQLISPGRLIGVGVNGALNGYALVDGPAKLFFTQSGGDAGQATSLRLSTRNRALTRKQLQRAGGTVTVDGVLPGAQGGERIVVSRRNLSGGAWQHQLSVAGANGGSFTTTWRVRGSSLFVAQWAGDSGRASSGSGVLRLTVR
jgi:photosystem II stability/assembly factor-like uncharacterized protein